MPQIRFLPEGKNIKSFANDTITSVASRSNIPIPTACGQKGRCSTCRVKVLQGLSHCTPRTAQEEIIAASIGLAPDVRLACQTCAVGDIDIEHHVQNDNQITFSSLYVKNNPAEHFGIEKHMFILFADIRGFTEFSENSLPYDVIFILNQYFHEMGKVIKKHDGEIDNYMGDAFLALFEADDPVEGAERAVQAGLEMLRIVRTVIRPNFKNFMDINFKIGIGLHYGLVVAGKVGTRQSHRKTVIGDAVNFASRIESANKETGTEFLISENAYALLKDRIKINHHFKRGLKGKKGLHDLYEVVAMN